MPVSAILLSYARMMTSAQRRSKDRRETGTRAQLLAATHVSVTAASPARRPGRSPTPPAPISRRSRTTSGRRSSSCRPRSPKSSARGPSPCSSSWRDPETRRTRLLQAVNTLSETFKQRHDRAPGLLEVFVHAVTRSRQRSPVAQIWRNLRSTRGGIVELLADGTIPDGSLPDAMAALYPRRGCRHGRQRDGRTRTCRSSCDRRTVRELVARSRDPSGGQGGPE